MYLCKNKVFSQFKLTLYSHLNGSRQPSVFTRCQYPPLILWLLMRADNLMSDSHLIFLFFGCHMRGMPQVNFFFFLFIIPLFGQVSGTSEDKLFKHMTGFPLIKSGGHLSQLFWNDTAGLQREMDSHRSYRHLSSLLHDGDVEGHSVSLPFWFAFSLNGFIGTKAYLQYPKQFALGSSKRLS